MGVPTAAFVDGLNLYHGLRDDGHLKFRWLDIEGVVISLAANADGSLGMSLDVTRIVYCTSMVADKQASRRQDIYLQALEQHCTRVEIRRGTYEEKVRVCAECGSEVGFQTEKQTDVNFAVEMVMEASRPVGQRAEVQLLVTGDTDLLPAVRAVRSCGIEVVAIAPPARGRARESFAAAASKTLRVRRRHLRDHLLPDPVLRPTSTGGVFPLRPPDGWTP
ncbi:NYN domain-containing protein [Candidatus Poriferisodalis sp.]|uniref:NYN domain-containing protein n=1 Tax=Candidatus Poriferisodalis sp. TaxID=3101277 RepID=UPI003B0139F4